MTREQLNAAFNINHDLSLLKEIQRALKNGHWVGFDWGGREQKGAMCFGTGIMNKAFEKTFTDYDYYKDNDYLFIGMFSTNGTLVEYTDVSFEITGKAIEA